MKAVILAAGEGKRLQPITSTRSKHMIPLAGKPILEHLLRSLKEGGITDIVIITGYQEELIHNYFKNGDQWNLKIEYIHQETPLGSGQAISLAEKYIEDDIFLVVYGDLLIKSSVIKSTIIQHNNVGLPILCVVPVDNPQQYGVVNLDENRVKGIIEKPWCETKPGHRDGAALRDVMKHFLADYWYVGRTLSGLPTTPLYPEAMLGGTHRTIMPEERGWKYLFYL